MGLGCAVVALARDLVDLAHVAVDPEHVEVALDCVVAAPGCEVEVLDHEMVVLGHGDEEVTPAREKEVHVNRALEQADVMLTTASVADLGLA